MQTLEKNDMQGLIARGYGELTAASFLLFEINDPASAKEYLRYLLKHNFITPAERKEISRAQKRTENEGAPLDHAVHIAFTSDGIRKLCGNDILRNFSREFVEGMDEEFRSTLLGDVGDNEPKKWEWGSRSKKVDGVLLCYAQNQKRLNEVLNQQIEKFEAKGIHLLRQNDTYETVLSKYGIFVEHFGFRDGISTPVIESFSKAYEDERYPIIKAGEFVLGYKNEYNVYPDSPWVTATNRHGNILPDDPNDKGKKDLGKNGTYLVFREIEQRVCDFWKYLEAASREPGEQDKDIISSTEAAIRLGAKMVGRWPSGAPLVLTPAKDDPNLYNAKHFSYAERDPNGVRCPFGAHIRRTNPRDQLHSGRDADQSQQMVRKHQILRRGRIFGEPLVASMKPEEMIEVKENNGKKRGLYFIGLVANIARQFEFIQNVWANNFVFADLCNEVDPLIAPRPRADEPFCNEFTVQSTPLPRRYKSVPKFTQVTGGAYFFLPGLRALYFFADCDPKLCDEQTVSATTSA